MVAAGDVETLFDDIDGRNDDKRRVALALRSVINLLRRESGRSTRRSRRPTPRRMPGRATAARGISRCGADSLCEAR